MMYSEGPLFTPVIEEAKQHESFKMLLQSDNHMPCRWMLEQAFSTYEDIDGTFLEGFQGEGFNARFFELYLHAYFSYSNYEISRPDPSPDFIVENAHGRVAVEATTTNPSKGGVLAKYGKKIEDLDSEQRLEYQRDELAVRFGGPLKAKLEKRYWEREECRGLPLVIAIQAFHDNQSLEFSDNGLARYAYGSDSVGVLDADGKLAVSSVRVDKHTVGSKTIPSGFFDLDDAEHVSGILFTNCGTSAKFFRMGYLHGHMNDELTIIRSGNAYDFHEDARDPTLFKYSLDNPPFVETWGQGLVLIRNPRAKFPVPKAFFEYAIEHRFDSDTMMLSTDHYGFWHPIASQTGNINLTSQKKELLNSPFSFAANQPQEIFSINKRDFQELVGINHDDNPLLEEDGWFGDATMAFLGVVFRDTEDDEWAFSVQARDSHSRFRSIKCNSGFATRATARDEMYAEMIRLLAVPQRFFVQD